VSWVLLPAVWAAELRPLEKLVLLQLADCANDAGGNVWRSVETVAHRCGVSARQVQRIFRNFEELGLLVLVREFDWTTHRPREYRINLDRLAEIGSNSRRASRKAGAPRSAGERQSQVTTSHQGLVTDSHPNPLITTLIPDDDNAHACARAQRSSDGARFPLKENGDDRGTRIPRDWRPSEADREFCLRHGVDIDAASSEFIDFWIAVPGEKGRKLDWSATFRNRVRTLADRAEATARWRGARQNRRSSGGIIAAISRTRLGRPL